MQNQKNMEKEIIVEIDLNQLVGFKNHPFQVKPDEDMIKLIQSIRQHGIMNPLIVRSIEDGRYEIISGHRRCFAARQIGLGKVPVIVYKLDDEEAIVKMVDANLSRSHILHSEKAFAYKMKYDAIRRKSGRRKIGQTDPYAGKRGLEILAKENGDSAKKIQRYIRITYLIPELLLLLDQDKIGFTPSVELSFLSEREQYLFLNALEATQCTPSLSQAKRIKQMSADKQISEERLIEILNEVKQKQPEQVVLKKSQLRKYFPTTYSTEEMQKEILEILDLWTRNFGRTR